MLEKFGVKKAINGEGMMLYQGAESFKLWTGKEMTVEHIKDILKFRVLKKYHEKSDTF